MARGPVRAEIPVPFPIRSVNAWIWPGSQAAIVDCGIGSIDGYQAIRAAIAGASAAGAWRLFATHGHVDHAGNAWRLRSELGIPLAAHPAESPLVETFRRDSAPRNERYAAALRLHGMPDDEVRRISTAGHAIDAMTQDCPIDVPLSDGQKVVLGDTEAVVEWAPGHTPGSVLIATQDGHLVTGDTLLERITSNAIELLPEDEGRHATYVRTLARLDRHVDRTVLPGHGAPFRLTHEILQRHLERHEARQGRILAALDAPRTAYELLARVFPNLSAGQEFLAMADVVGHLNQLEALGVVARREAAGTRRFHKAA